MQTGADAVLHAAVGAGVSVCFANPGTTEMHFVQGVDNAARTGAMRAVLCLHENVATGAADGYARMARSPAMTLLHLGPGYANGAQSRRYACVLIAALTLKMGRRDKTRAAFSYRTCEPPQCPASRQPGREPGRQHVDVARECGSAAVDGHRGVGIDRQLFGAHCIDSGRPDSCHGRRLPSGDGAAARRPVQSCHPRRAT